MKGGPSAYITDRECQNTKRKDTRGSLERRQKYLQVSQVFEKQAKAFTCRAKKHLTFIPEVNLFETDERK